MTLRLFCLAPPGSLLAVFFAWLFYRQMKKQSEGTELMTRIASSALSGFLGMKSVTYASARTANADKSPPSSGLRITFQIAAVMSLIVIGWGCLGSNFSSEPATAREIESHIRFLSDDSLEGRAVGSKGIAVAESYLEDFFKTFSLEPAFGSSYRQSFVLRGAKPDANARLEFFSDKVSLVPVFSQDFFVRTEREDLPDEVSGEVVYCGDLTRAPLGNPEDFKAVDLQGKVLLVEINDPEGDSGGALDGQDRIERGSWKAEFEIAAELRAAGVLLILNAKSGGQGWENIRNSWDRESFFFPDKDLPLSFQGWIREETVEALISSVKMSPEELLAKVRGPDFAPVPLGLRARLRQQPLFRTVSAQNIGAMIRGKHHEANDSAIILSAHHDHLGKNENHSGDQIYNGAVDNAAGAASLLALAAFFAQRPEDLKVNLFFISFTAEEEDLIGSDYFIKHNPIPDSSVLADIDLEMVNVWGKTKAVIAVGGRHSDLEEACRIAAEDLGLVYRSEPKDNRGPLSCAGWMSFARSGIPAVGLGRGIVSPGENKELATLKFEEYRASRFHNVTDVIGNDWDFNGTLEIIRWVQEIVRRLERRDNISKLKPQNKS